MTRGTAYCILEDGSCISCCEFNGDMYPGGHYEEMVERLQRVTSRQTFDQEIIAFDAANFQYQDEDKELPVERRYFGFNTWDPDKVFTLRPPRPPEEEADPKTARWRRDDGVVNIEDSAYFELYFSDYLFWINLGDDPVRFVDRDGKETELEKGAVLTMNFGHLCQHQAPGGCTTTWTDEF
tara:strand:+ start:64 stop:606 length:543 start_codon:yes stop_codon:yes gene_type:complete